MWGAARAALQEAPALQCIGTQEDASHPGNVSMMDVSTINSAAAGVGAPGAARYPTRLAGGVASVPRLLSLAPSADEWCDLWINWLQFQ